MIKKLGIALFLLLGIVIAATGFIWEDWKVVGGGIAVIVVGVGVIVLASTVFKKQMDTKAIIGADPVLESIKAAVASGAVSTRAQVLDAQVKYLCRTGEVKGAVLLATKAASVAEKRHGKGHPEAIRILTTAGVAFGMAERFGEAEPLLARAVLLMECSASPDQRELATALRQLAEVRMCLGQFDRAEESCRSLVSLKEKEFGSESAELAATYEDLAELIRRAGGAKARVVAMRRMAESIRSGKRAARPAA
jgi:tetratricopeptide (TPR) repeat protein